MMWYKALYMRFLSQIIIYCWRWNAGNSAIPTKEVGILSGISRKEELAESILAL